LRWDWGSDRGIHFKLYSYLNEYLRALSWHFGYWLGWYCLGLVFQSLKKAGEEIPSRNQLKTYRIGGEIEKKQNFERGIAKCYSGFFWKLILTHPIGWRRA